MSPQSAANPKMIWWNGKIVDEKDARISLFSHVIHYGTGAFEGIRAYQQKDGGGAVFRLHEHMERLEESFKILGFKLPYSVDQLCEAVKETCRANDLQECYLRPIAFLGEGPLGVNPGDNPRVDVAILAMKWGKYLGDQAAQAGARLKISSHVRPHVNSVMTKGKISGNYVNSVLAKREAVKLGFSEALLLDPEGYLAEGSGENLFMIRDGIVKTTPLTSILSGITRASVIELLRSQGMQVVEARFTRDELWCADEVFLTGTAAEITPIADIDFRPIGRGEKAGRAGQISMKLSETFQKVVRGELKPEYAKNWLSKI